MSIARKRLAECRPVIVWWEKRRLYFNLLVLATGTVSVVLAEVIGGRLIPLGEDLVEPLMLLAGAIAYVAAANLFYSMGWVTEIVWSNGNPDAFAELRPKVLRQGMIFSFCLTIAPGMLFLIIWILTGFK